MVAAWGRARSPRRRLALWLCLPLAACLAPLAPVRLGVTVGQSMVPTLPAGCPFVIDRTYYRRHPLARGDIVVFRRNGQTYVKRVHQVGGQPFWLWISPDGQDGPDDKLIVPLNQVERYVRLDSSRAVDGRLERIGLPEGVVYVVGDNEGASIDSRDFGPIPEKLILGRVRPLLPRPKPEPSREGVPGQAGRKMMS